MSIQYALLAVKVLFFASGIAVIVQCERIKRICDRATKR